MWFALLLVVVTTVFASPDEDFNASPYIFENEINNTINQIASNLAKMDPAIISNLNFNINNEKVKMKIDLTDTRVEGFSKFRATNLEISIFPPSMTFDLVFDNVFVIIPNYNLDATIVFLPVYGNGFLSLRTTLLSLGGGAEVKINPDGIESVSNVAVRFSLKESNLTISGFLDNEGVSHILSTATTQCFPEFINRYGERLGSVVSNIVENLLNTALQPSRKEFSFPLEGKYSFQLDDTTINYNYKV